LGEEEDTPENLDEDLEPITEEMEPQIFIITMCGNTGFQTMRINGHVGKKTIHIFIDSGVLTTSWMISWPGNWL